MIKQAKQIQDWCEEKGFNFVDCDYMGVKIPCALDRGYKKSDQTIFISGFYEGSRKIIVSYGGLKNQMSLKTPIDSWDIKAIEKHCIPAGYVCAKCKKNNLNLRTQDNHKTYDCPDCQKPEKKDNTSKR